MPATQTSKLDPWSGSLLLLAVILPLVLMFVVPAREMNRKRRALHYFNVPGSTQPLSLKKGGYEIYLQNSPNPFQGLRGAKGGISSPRTIDLARVFSCQLIDLFDNHVVRNGVTKGTWMPKFMTSAGLTEGVFDVAVPRNGQYQIFCTTNAVLSTGLMTMAIGKSATVLPQQALFLFAAFVGALLFMHQGSRQLKRRRLLDQLY